MSCICRSVWIHTDDMLLPMDINDRLYVELHPLKSGQIPHPEPVSEAHFDPALVYKVLGMYNPSETSECYMILANPNRQIWFIPQRHLLAFGLVDSDEFFLSKDQANVLRRNGRGVSPRVAHFAGQTFPGEDRLIDNNGHQSKDRLTQR
jgi:hypothetical protein